MELVVANAVGRPDSGGEEPDAGGVWLSRQSKDAATCRWTIAPFSKVGAGRIRTPLLERTVRFELSEQHTTLERPNCRLPCWAFTAACAPQVKQRTLWSRYFEVGGYDWRLLVYPSGDSQALPGYISLYVQVGRATPTPVAFAHRTACILAERRLVCSVHAATLHGAEGPVSAKASDSDGESEERSVRRRGCWDGSGGFSCVSDSQLHRPS